MRDVLISWDPDSDDIRVSTDSTVGSGEKVYVKLYDDNGDDVGALIIYFSSPIKYWIDWCSTSWPTFQETLPTETDKTWRISYTPAENRLLVHCNGKEVLNKVVSASVCGRGDWRPIWERYPTKIKFYSSDTASQQYCLEDGSSLPGMYLS